MAEPRTLQPYIDLGVDTGPSNIPRTVNPDDTATDVTAGATPMKADDLPTATPPD